MSTLRDDIQAWLENYVDTPDWEKDDDNPLGALSHQTLICIAAATGLRSVLEDRITELLAKHDNFQDFLSDLDFVGDEITNDLQRALHGTDLGEQCRVYEMECPVTLNALRKRVASR